jgi:hypothetical protein
MLRRRSNRTHADMRDHPKSLLLAALAWAACTPDTNEPTGDSSLSTLSGNPPPVSSDPNDDDTGPDTPTTGGATEPGTTDGTTDPDTGDAPTGDEPTTAGGDAVTIYDVQQGKVPEQTVVELADVVVTSPVFLTVDGEANFFIAEQPGGEYSGIQVYVDAGVTAELDGEGKLPGPGDVLDLRATYQEFFDYSELTLLAAADLTITGAGAVPDPAVVAAADIATGGAKAENYEGCLVQVDGATVTAPVMMYGEFTVDDALIVDDLFFVPAPGPKPPLGTEFTALVGQLTYGFEAFKLAPRSCADLQGWDGCADPDPPNPECIPGGSVTIDEIQQDEVCAAEVVTITDAVVTTDLTFKQDGFFVQDPSGGEYSGIFVYVGADNPNAISVAPGDVVTVTGVYDEFYGMSQIEVAAAADVVVTDFAAVPAPALVDPAAVATGGADAEAYEAVLVRVVDVTVLANDLGFGEWSVDGDLRVDDLFFAAVDWTVPNPGDPYESISGPLVFSFDTTKIAPRTAADLQPAP